jgi:hypothetical protein
MADGVTQVFDATGPSTKTVIFNKSAGAGSSYFQAVGNNLYFGNGVDQKKWVQTAKVWLALTQFVGGNFLVDANNNLQLCVGLRTFTISAVSITANVLTLVFSTNISFMAGMQVGLSGLVTNTFLNGNTITITSATQNTITAAFVHAM